MYTIGEFSRITGITVKALRHYHDQGLLAPSRVDAQTGYRYYDDAKIEPARAITFLRSVDFPLDRIRELLAQGGGGDDGRLLDALEQHRQTLREEITRLGGVVRSLDAFLTQERQARTLMSHGESRVEEKDVAPMLIAGVRMRGRYADCGKGFARIGRKLGRYIVGKPMLLHYDDEYREADADFEAAMPVGRPKGAAAPDEIDLRELPGGRCVALLHRGPYDQMGPSYAAALKYVKEKGYRALMPSREVYIKGPGMIFKGNPRNYLTEIQIFVERERS